MNGGANDAAVPISSSSQFLIGVISNEIAGPRLEWIGEAPPLRIADFEDYSRLLFVVRLRERACVKKKEKRFAITHAALKPLRLNFTAPIVACPSAQMGLVQSNRYRGS